MDELVNDMSNICIDDADNSCIRYDENNRITKLLMEIDNDYQSDIVLKLFCGYSGYVYLSDYIKERGEVYILGAKNTRGREVYVVKIEEDYSLSCTCKDFQYRSHKLNTVCKHIVFLVCKVGGVLDVNYFKTKRLDIEQYKRLINVLDSNAIWRDSLYSVKNMNKEFEDDFKFDKMDVCPICYDNFGNVKENVCCPECKNYMHKKCMDVWLEKNKSCVYCRSYVWNKYISNINEID